MFDLPQHVKHVLVAPLNWGLGHASRSIVIIQELLKRNIKVTIASDGDALHFLSLEFPELDLITLPSYNVRYNGKSFISNLLKNSQKILSAIKEEKEVLDKTLTELSFDLIISDCRFGIKSNSIPSVILTHQLKLITPSSILSKIVNSINRKFLNSFDEVWVPDYPNRKLSGRLSENRKINNVKWIGPLSNLKTETELKIDKNEGMTIILSGPEPARTKLENQLLTHLKMFDNITLVRGSQALTPLKKDNNWKVINLASRDKINELLLESKLVISRSGYSSIMDYDKLKTSAILIPTPGQTEQEYLASRLKGEEKFSSIEEYELQELEKMIRSKVI